MSALGPEEPETDRPESLEDTRLSLEQASDFVARVLERLAERREPHSRYAVKEELAQGGQGAVLRVWDEDLRRDLAMKVVGKQGPGAETVSDRSLGRFLEEAQVTGQLDHPGIVPVHDLGLDAYRRVYFTMKLVRGRDLLRVYELARYREEGWTQTRAVSVLLRVCEAMAYAHSKGVIHRDLKPSNVMVGRFGEVYVMDWGLARVRGHADLRDIRIQEHQDPTTSLDVEHGDSDSPLLTMDGDVVGTPAYMSPEQASGHLEQMGPHSDVYSVGAMLYQLLTGQAPYRPPGIKLSNFAVWHKACSVAPEPVSSLAPDVPPELESICAKAMARDVSARYADMQALADDLRAYLEGRVVRAYEAGAVAELKKWVKRNRGVAVASLVAFVLALGGLASTTYFQTRGRILAAEKEREARWQSYVANVLAASSMLDAGNLFEMNRRLEACAPELRGWEWHHLRLNQDESRLVLRGHEGRVTSVAFSPDGKEIVSGSPEDQRVRIWDASSGEPLRVLEGHAGEFWGEFPVVYDPQGRLIASASEDRDIVLWDPAQGTVVRRFAPRVGEIHALAFSPDGQRLALAAEDPDVTVRDVADGELVLRMEGHSGQVSSVAFSPDGTRVATGSEDETVRVWDARAGTPLEVFTGHGAPVLAVAFSPDGTYLASASNQDVKLRDAASGQVLRVLSGPVGNVRVLAFSPDGRLLATAAKDQHAVRVWDVESGSLRATLLGHAGVVWSLAFSPDGTRLASASYDETVRVFDLDLVHTSHALEVGDARDVATQVAFSPDGTTLACGSYDGIVRLWDAATGEGTRLLRGHEQQAYSLSFSPDSSRLATGGWDDTLRIWSLATGRSLATLRGHGDSVFAVAYSPDGRTLATGSFDRTVRIWDAQKFVPLATLEGHESSVWALAYLPDGRLVSGSWDGTLRIWDPSSGELLHVLAGHEDKVFAVATSSDGRLIASGAWDRSVRLWDPDTGALVETLPGPASLVLCVAFSPDGTRLAAGLFDQTVRLWDVSSGETVATLRGHLDPVTSVAFSPDGKRIVSSSQDGTLRVWESERASAERMSR